MILKRYFGKRDALFLFAVSLFLIAFYCVLFFNAYGRRTGAFVLVEVDGEEYGRYGLYEDLSVPIEIDGEVENIIEIKSGKAAMKEAKCPDKLCVKQGAIKYCGQSIVCLPHKVVVSIIEDGGELDSVVR